MINTGILHEQGGGITAVAMARRHRGRGQKKNKNGWLSEIKFWILPVTKRIIMGILNFSAN